MTGEPVTTGILLAASAAATEVGLLASSQQEKLDLATLNTEAARAKEVAAEQGLSSAKSFRSALSSQLALSSLQGGSAVRQFGAESFANFLADQNAIKSKQKFIDVSKDLGTAQTKAGRFSRDVSSITSLLSGGLGAVNLNK